MNKILRIFLIFTVFLIFFMIQTFAKYSFTNKINAYELTIKMSDEKNNENKSLDNETFKEKAYNTYNKSLMENDDITEIIQIIR